MPVDVSGLSSGVVAVAAGEYHTCALTGSGGVKCWGNNDDGQLGDGTTRDRLTPVNVSGLRGSVAAVAAGAGHTCALTSSGGVKCWGSNGAGQLGDGTTENRLTPANVSGLGSGVAAVAAGEEHTCALTSSGGVKCWGDNDNGQLGDGTQTDRLTPVDVSGLGSGAAAIATGWDHTCALTGSGGLKCWGYNGYGQIGTGVPIFRTTPVDVVGMQGERVPIVFIPGLMGSRLFNTVNGERQEIWANVDKIASLLTSPHPLMVLGLAEDGSTPASDDPAYTSIHTIAGTEGILTRVTGTAWEIKPVDEDFYDTLVNHFKSLGYAEGVDFWVYPYDWRKDLRTSADGLDILVQSIIDQTGSSQVYIVSHSLGGLITRQYISNPARAARVKGTIILGAPFLGTPKAFYALLEGDCIERFGPFCFPKKQVIKALVPNYPAFYQIMPSEAYFAVKGGGFYGIGPNLDIAGKCQDCLTFDETYVPSVAPNLNSLLSADAKQFHSDLDNLSDWNGVPVTIVAGRGEETIVGIRQYEKMCGARDIWAPCTIRVPEAKRAGDGDVTLLSVSMSGTVNLRGSAPFTTFDVDHQGLVKEPVVLDYVDSVLGLSATRISQQAAEAVTDGTGAQIVAFRAIAIHAYDPLGNHTGPVAETDLIKQGIPGSLYFSGQDMASVALIGGQTYTVTIIPSGIGPVDAMLIRSTMADTFTTTLYTSISVTAQSRIRFVGDPYLTDTWQLDVDGTGSNIQSIAPTLVFTSGEHIDSIPPTTTIRLEGTMGPNGWYVSPVTVTLMASDNPTGTGVSRIEYAFSNDWQPRIYSEPFVVSPGDVAVIYAIAVDQAGNMQVPPTQARIGPEPPANVVISGPAVGSINAQVTFTAIFTQGTVVLPVRYTWEATEQTPVTKMGELASAVTFTWLTSGDKTITVTVSKRDDPATVYAQDAHAIRIQGYAIYLPVVLKNQ